MSRAAGPLRWVATAKATIAEILAAMGLDPAASAQAIDDGRVFLDRRRVKRADAIVEVRSEVLVHPAPAQAALPEPFVLHDRDGVLAVDKPAGVATIPDTASAAGTLIDLAARATGRAIDGLHPTSRLDRDVSGVVLFATTKDARDALAEAREAGRYERRYVAIAAGDPPDRARWTWGIDRARDPRLRRAVEHGGKPSATRVRVVERAAIGSRRFALLALAPETGRTHQIRVHAAAASAPLVGDRAYGGPTRLASPSGKVLDVGRVALHCAQVRVDLGRSRCMISVGSPVSRELVELAAAIGLDHFEEAIACEV